MQRCIQMKPTRKRSKGKIKKILKNKNKIQQKEKKTQISTAVAFARTCVLCDASADASGFLNAATSIE